MALNAMPVFPLVASTMQSPGFIFAGTVGLFKNVQGHPVLILPVKIIMLALDKNTVRGSGSGNGKRSLSSVYYRRAAKGD